MIREGIISESKQHPFWTLSLSEIEGELQTDIKNGISEEEAKKRLKVFGSNVIEKSHKFTRFSIFFNQFKSPLILILFIAGTLMFFIKHYNDALFIFAAVLVNVALGFYQEFKAERALAELKTYIKQRSRIIRDGIEHEIDSTQIVPGDCIFLSQGDRVPADGRLVFINDLQIDEAILTGESLPVSKSIEPSIFAATLNDQRSMVFAGTLVNQGIGVAVACRTGLSTELGKIAALVADSRQEETPLQKKIKTFSLQIGGFLGVLTLIIFGTGIAFGYSYIEMFLTSVAIAVAAVPEGLPVAMTVILAIGVQRIAKRNGVVRKLIAAEALGSVTVILTDKTGTLTQAKMTLSKILPVVKGDEEKIIELALLNTNVLVENPHDKPSEWHMSGRVLEISLVRSAALRGITLENVKSKISVLNSLPFNAVNKFSASLIRYCDKHFLVFFGAPDILITHSTLSTVQQKETLMQIDDLARSGELVMGIATKQIESGNDFVFSKDLKVTQLSFNGLLTLHDPVRPSAKESIRRVASAGIRTMIVTGDHRGTAEAIAKEVGINIDDKNILDAQELRMLSDDDLKKRLPSLRVISRVSPLDKMRIVQILQNMGEVVAMTGDGVNDAPSIKQADIGIAMGSGTEVAREVADLVLLDDNFETIVASVEEGRQIMHNIQKALVFILSGITDELFLIGGALITGLTLPINALQILWVNFFSDSFPVVAFAFEKNIDVMGNHPHNRKTSLFNPLMKFLILFIGISTSALLFVLYWLFLRVGFPEDIVRTFIFASFGSYMLFLSFSLRSLDKSIFKYSLFSNSYLVMGVSIGIILMGASIYVPFLQSIFGTVSLPFVWIVGVFSVGMVNIIAVEFGKWIFNRKYLIQQN